MTTESLAWTFERPLGRLCCGALTGAVDVSRPQLGLHELRIRGAAVDGELLAASWLAADDAPPISSAADRSADWPMEVADAYVRGSDLVATYQRHPDWPFTPQIYWRAEPTGWPGSGDNRRSAAADEPPSIAALSLLVSVQTDVLDSHPRIRITTRLAADEVVRIGPRDAMADCLLWRLPGGEVSYAEIAPAGDVRDLSVESAGAGMWRAQWDLFADFLEKGVIRRARLQSVFLPRARDEERAAACIRAVQQRPLPLTT